VLMRACCELIIDIAKLHYVYVLSELNNDDDDDDNYFVIANLLRLALYGKGIKQSVYLSVCLSFSNSVSFTRWQYARVTA